MTSRRDRLLAEGMRLFGEQGYQATSVAQIEAAAGLSPGSGSLYKHFRSKKALLEAGLDRLLAPADRPVPPPLDESVDVAAALVASTRAGMDRMDEDRDLSRVLFRGLADFPELRDRFGAEEIARIGHDTADFLARLADPAAVPDDADWEAVAVVFQGALSQFWLLEDIFDGRHPSSITRERFMAALNLVAARMLGADTSAAAE